MLGIDKTDDSFKIQRIAGGYPQEFILYPEYLIRSVQDHIDGMFGDLRNRSVYVKPVFFADRLNLLKDPRTLVLADGNNAPFFDAFSTVGYDLADVDFRDGSQPVAFFTGPVG